MSVSNNEKVDKPRPLIDLLISIVIPSVILMKFSGAEDLGPTRALIIALAFPVGYGLYELLFNKKRNWMALLGVISVLLTGGIGLLKIDAQWLAVKEAAIPLCIGIGVLVASKLGFPLVKKLLFNPTIMNIDKINEELEKRDNREVFDNRLNRANTLLAGTFFFSAVMNYFLAKFIVKSESGTAAFNEELGRMTLLSYPVIAIPSMIMMLAIFWFIWRTVNKLTELSLEDIMVTDKQ
ncbi:MAG: VC0807 family protein [Granulosicoccus sp.]